MCNNQLAVPMSSGNSSRVTAVLTIIRRIFECLPEEAGTFDGRSGGVSRLEVEGHDLISRDAVEIAFWAEPQASGVAEKDRPVRSEDPDESAAGAVVLANARNGVAPAEGPFAGHHNVAVGCDGEIKRA